MAKYTFELREMFEPIRYTPPLFSRDEVEGWFKDYDLYDYLTIEQVNVIEKADIWSKDRLARKIVDHYYMRESGLETPAMLKHYAKVRMQELMEEYLPLIYSASIYYDPLINVDYTETFERGMDRKTETEATQTGTDKSTSFVVNSDTPQGQINKNTILNGNYASETSASDNDTSTSSNGSSNENENIDENYTKRVRGNSGVSATAQKMVEQYRANIRSIDREIIEKLHTLFMGLY